MGAKPGLTGPAPLSSRLGPGRGGDPALNTFGETALRSHRLLPGPAVGSRGSGFPSGRSPFPANLSPWPQHHLLEILQHDTRVAGNVFQRDCPRRGILELESPPWAWGSLGEGLASSHVNRLAVSLTSSKAYCTLLLDMFLNHYLAVTSPTNPPDYHPPSKSLGLFYPTPGRTSLLVSMAVRPSAVYLDLPSSLCLPFLGTGTLRPIVPSLRVSVCGPGENMGPCTTS